jgi:hypothetical protein
MLAVKGKITCEEFRALEQADRDAQDEFARRPEGEMPDWAVPLIDEIAALDEAVLANAIPGYADMASDEREIFYCHGLRRRLYPLARSGRMTPEEYSAVRGMLMRERFSH